MPPIFHRAMVSRHYKNNFVHKNASDRLDGLDGAKHAAG